MEVFGVFLGLVYSALNHESENVIVAYIIIVRVTFDNVIPVDSGAKRTSFKTDLKQIFSRVCQCPFGYIFNVSNTPHIV